MSKWQGTRNLSTAMLHAMQYLRRYDPKRQGIPMQPSWLNKLSLKSLVERGLVDVWTDDGETMVRLKR